MKRIKDIINKDIIFRGSSKSVKFRESVYIDSGLSIFDALDLMYKNGFESLAVINGGNQIGVITKDCILLELKRFIEGLEGDIYYFKHTIGEITHELKNSLTTLKGIVQIIKNNKDKGLYEYIMVFEREIERINSLANDLYIFSLSDKIN